MAKSLKLIIEALLFASDRPLRVRDLHACLPEAKIADIKGALEILEHEYDSLGRSFDLKEIAEGYQFRTRSEYGPYILTMLQTSPSRLSRAAIETLAIVAYKQPILRHEVERLRGVDVGGILKTLLEKDLIRVMGRKELPGRPLIYGTTKRFLEVFDLKDIKSLPKLKEIKSLGGDEFMAQPLAEQPPPEDSPPQETPAEDERSEPTD
jgi:segregation and condensation protein B